MCGKFHSIVKAKLYLIPVAFIIVTLLDLDAQQILTNPVPYTNQLPSKSVQRVFQDKDGFMWFGTQDGLCRYDGYRILVFRSDLNNPNLLTDNEITCITEDKTGHLLIGTKKGVNILDKKTYQIKPFHHEEIKDKEIRSMIVASNGDIWIGTMSFVLKFNPDFTLHKRYDNSLPTTSVNSIYEDNDGNIWTMLWQSGLHKYDPNKDTFNRFPKIGTTDNPFKIFQDNEKRYWICTWGDGIYSLNLSADGQNIYTHHKIATGERQLEENYLFSIAQDDKYGYIWVMSTSGIYALEYTPTGKLNNIDISYLFENSNNIFSELIKDKAGNLWVGTFSEGAFTINFDKPAIQNFPMALIKKKTGIAPNITSIHKDKHGYIWFNQNRWGLGIYVPLKNEIRFFKDIPMLKDISTMSMVSCIHEFTTFPEEIWIGPENESIIYCIKRNTDNTILSTREIDLRKISDNAGNPRIFFEDSKNNIWVVTTTGLLIQPYPKKDMERMNISFPSLITGITEDQNNTIWISTRKSGIYRITEYADPSNPQTDEYSSQNSLLISNNIEAVCCDRNGKLWIGTKEGNIIVYDITERKFTDMSQSFRMYGEGILNILADNDNHIWVSTNKKMTEYNPVNQALRDYTQMDGILINSFIQNSYYQDPSGEIFFGGNKGISVFTSSQNLSEHSRKTKTVIADIKINNQSVFKRNNNKQFNIHAQTIQFEPDDKNIEIDFSTLDYTFPNKIRYAYKMEDVDDKWIYTEDNRQFAIYNQLSKGSHRFHVKATDENNLWSNETAELKIYKRPAFYETGWAYTIYLFVVISLIYFIYKRAKNRIKLRNDLKISQIEKEKTEELTQAKLRYFTNISHDFLTPLTIISCLIDDIEITDKGKVSQLEIMRSNINRLKRLLQQILDFRKVESGNMKLKISQGNIAGFIKDSCYINFEPLMRKKHITFSFHSDPDKIHAFFDADKIDKIIFNLLSNAFKYTPVQGEVGVDIKQYFNREHSHLQIKISDTGNGIAPADLRSIFNRFYTNEMSEFGESNGIGLSLTKELLDIHHGTIKVESQTGKGTTFTIDFPIDKESYDTSELGYQECIMPTEENMNLLYSHGVTPEEINKSTTYKHDDITILLVEDNEELLVLMFNILSKHYHVIASKNGLEATCLIKENDIDIVISDVMMPKMDGMELCRTLKNNIETNHIPVILLTAKNSTDDRIECYNAGADGYISKPFELKLLEARIENFILNKKLRQQAFRSNAEIDVSKLEYSTTDETFLNNVISIIDKNLSEVNFDVNILAENLNLSKSSLYRKIKTMTGLSPIEFIRNIKLKHACQMLKMSSRSISEVAYASGFSNPKYFATCFKSEFGMTPTEYQNR